MPKSTQWSRWVDEADRFDRMLEPFGVLVVDRAELLPGDRVLDVGCGTGAVSRLAAAQVGTDGTVTGIDLDPALIDVARHRAGDLYNVTHRVGDASVVSGGPFDAVVSRFALMLLDDPGRALARFASLLRRGGRCAWCVWTEPAANEWFTLPFEVVGVPVPSTAPPFALADGERNVALMRAAGFRSVTVQRVDQPVWLGRDSEDVLAAFDVVPQGAGGGVALDRARRRLDAATTADGVLVAASAWVLSGRVEG